MTRSRARRAREARRGGFSLIELMVVVAIMGLLATVVAVKLVGVGVTAKVARVGADFDSIKKAIAIHKLSTGQWPRRLDELWEKPAGLRNWQKLLSGPPRDPWGHAYVYAPPSGSGEFLVTSYGADGAPGGTGEDQDITTDTIDKLEQGEN